MLVLLLFVSIFAASLNSVLLHKLPQKSNVFAFNLIGSLIWMIILFCVNGFKIDFNSTNILWGVLYGVIQMLFMIFKTKSMGSGPVSITTLIGNCSLILSTSVGVLVWKEDISIWQILGILILISAFFLCTYQKSGTKASKMWVIYCVFFFVFAAGVGIVFKCFSKANGGSAGDMMIIAAFTMAVLFLCKILLDKLGGKTEEDGAQKSIGFNKVFLILALSSGVLSCLYNRLNISLAGLFDSAIFYPCFNGGVILLSLALSMIILKERITKRQAVGLALGTAAVLIIGFC